MYVNLSHFLQRYKVLLFAAALGLLLLAFWSFPIPGQVMIAREDWRYSATWPRITVLPNDPRPNQLATITIIDVQPWTDLKVLIDDESARFQGYVETGADGYWGWSWTFTVPDTVSYMVVFYHSCNTGCIERSRFSVGIDSDLEPAPKDELIPTKLGVVFADPDRDWHNRSGWDVELTYASQAEAEYWGVDDLATRIQRAARKGLRVLVRIDYDLGQALPPAEDYQAMDTYLTYVARLAQDDRLKSVYGYIIGSSYNGIGSNSKATDRPVTPEWYARLFSGYQADPAHDDNVVEVIRKLNPLVRVLVGPVRPWIDDQDGRLQYQRNVKWLNYMNTLVAALDEAAAANEAVGVSLVAPDGFAVQAPGRPAAHALGGVLGAGEPSIDWVRTASHGARGGFRVFEDWLDIVNGFGHTRGLPLYITSTNTFAQDDGVVPADNYPRGWLASALRVVNMEPQVLALCWFIDDFPMDTQWQYFSLTNPKGLLMDAAEEFNELLENPP